MGAEQPREREEIDHEAEAQRLLESEREYHGLGWETADAQHHAVLMEAQVHATLALVEAQREANEQAMISNLIALGNAERGPYRYLDAGVTEMRSEDVFGAAARMLGVGGDDASAG